MNLEDYFPEDPFLPSLCYAAAQQLPVNLPWTSQRITLGTGFLLSDPASREPLRGSEAISSTYREQNLPIYHEDNSGTYVEAMSTTAGSAYDHVDLSIAASVGGSLLGASGRGTYETKTLACRDVSVPTESWIRGTFADLYQGDQSLSKIDFSCRYNHFRKLALVVYCCAADLTPIEIEYV